MEVLKILILFKKIKFLKIEKQNQSFENLWKISWFYIFLEKSENFGNSWKSRNF